MCLASLWLPTIRPKADWDRHSLSKGRGCSRRPVRGSDGSQETVARNGRCEKQDGRQTGPSQPLAAPPSPAVAAVFSLAAFRLDAHGARHHRRWTTGVSRGGCVGPGSRYEVTCPFRLPHSACLQSSRLISRNTHTHHLAWKGQRNTPLDNLLSHEFLVVPACKACSCSSSTDEMPAAGHPSYSHPPILFTKFQHAPGKGKVTSRTP